MQKVHFFTFVALFVIIGILFWATQAEQLGKIGSQFVGPSITLPPDLTPFPTVDPNQANQQTQGAQTQQQTPEQQAQQQQQQQTQPDLRDIISSEVNATITTSKGDIKVKLYPKEAPNTVLNFVTKAKSGYYNNLKFHRVEDWVIQGGDPTGDGTGGGLMVSEFNQRPFGAGAIGMAKRANIQESNDSQFFITKIDSTHLNGQYTNFGDVVEGMEVVNQIEIGDTITGITIE